MAPLRFFGALICLPALMPHGRVWLPRQTERGLLRIQCHLCLRKSRIVFYIPSTSPSPTKRISGIALGKGGRYRLAAESCVSPRIRICGWVKRSRWNSRGPGPWTTGLTSTSGFGIVVRSARGEVEVRITADEFRFSAPAPVIRRSHSQPIRPHSPL